MGTLVVVAVVVVVLGVLIVRRNNTGRSEAGVKATPVTSPVVTTPSVEDRERGLLLLNLKVREAGVNSSVLEAFELVVDRLRMIMPRVSEFAPNSDSDWTVKKVASDYLPRLIHPYLSLQAETRSTAESEVTSSLKLLREQLDKMQASVEEGNLGAFKMQSEFLKAKFLA